jgi:glycosyltransferase involved in cell wall biosynthesis
MQHQQMDVTVIVTAYNEAKYIRRCLDSLAQQSYQSYEVIIVDDGSTDQTAQIAAEYATRHPHFKLLKQEHVGPGEARNLAAQVAVGKILLICDADMVFSPRYIEKLIEPIQQGHCLGTFSKEEYVINYNNIWAKLWNYHDGMKDNRRHPAWWPDEDDIYRAIDRGVFIEVGGFSARGSGDDKSLSAKLGQKAKVAPGAICYHHNPDSPAEIFRQARWYARGPRVPFSWNRLIRSTLPFSLARSLKRTIRYRQPLFPLFKIIFDYGTFRGLLDKKISGGHGK